MAKKKTNGARREYATGDSVNIQSRLPHSDWARLQFLASSRKAKMADVIAAAVVEYVNKEMKS